MKKWLIALFLTLAIASATYFYAGYYNGPLFHDMPAADANPAKPAIVMLSGDMATGSG